MLIKWKLLKKDADKLKNVVDHEIDKNTKFDILNIKWNNLEKKIIFSRSIWYLKIKK